MKNLSKSFLLIVLAIAFFGVSNTNSQCPFTVTGHISGIVGAYTRVKVTAVSLVNSSSVTVNVNGLGYYYIYMQDSCEPNATNGSVIVSPSNNGVTGNAHWSPGSRFYDPIPFSTGDSFEDQDFTWTG